MLKIPFLSILALCSFAVLAEVEFEEKIERVRFIENLASVENAVAVEAYRRELEYEREDIPLDLRAQREARLLSDQLTAQVRQRYQELSEELGPTEALGVVRQEIDNDLAQIDPELKSEIESLAISALDEVSRGHSRPVTDHSRLQQRMLQGVRQRVSFLNQRSKSSRLQALKLLEWPELHQLTREQLRNTTKRQVLEALVSEKELAPFLMASSVTVRSEMASRSDSRVSIQIKADFLGASIEAGPTVHFNRIYKTQAVVMAEGLAPLINTNGTFDLTRRDRFGTTVPGKRMAMITCEVSLDFNADYTGTGGFSVLGVGGSASVSREYSNSVRVNSNRIILPETIDGRSVDLPYLSQLCHRDFLKAQVSGTVDVAGSLNIMMRNVLAGVRITRGRR